jgi:3-deoxy-D-manno-octulosonic-acid transferase
LDLAFVQENVGSFLLLLTGSNPLRALYSLLVSIVGVMMHGVAWVHGKSRLWVNGRKDWRTRLIDWRKNNPGELYWFHCASLGEFEQGRPVMERLRKERPEVVVLLTFFSPSGYEVRKNYSGADGVFYLPLDTHSGSRKFLDIVQPKVACFVKYEYWPNYFLNCKRKGIPLIMISAILRPDQRFFGWSGFFWKPILESVSHYFVQDEVTLKLLSEIGIERATLAGDTRFDRVLEIAETAKEVSEIREWAQGARVLIGGSTWPADERVLQSWWQRASNEWKLLIVPHEVSHAHLDAIRVMWPESLLWSQRKVAGLQTSRVVIMDEIGMLSTLYKYANVAWIGGGFGAGIHNTLEAAAWGLPVVFGPRYEKFVEAKGLIAVEGALAAGNEYEAEQILVQLTFNSTEMARMGAAAGGFVATGRGATDKIMSFLRAS